METIIHRSWHGSTVFDESGLQLRSMFGGAAQLTWSEIKSFSIVPVLKRRAGEWVEEPNEFLPEGFKSVWASHGKLELNLILVDRRPLLERVEGWGLRIWLNIALRPMFDGDGRPKVDQSLLRFSLSRSSVNGALFPLLDMLEARSTYELITFW